MTTTEQLLDNPTLATLIAKCPWIDPHWQFDKAVERCRTTPERLAAAILDCRRKRNPCAAAIVGLRKYGYQPTDKSLRFVLSILHPQEVNRDVAAAVKGMFRDVEWGHEKTDDHKKADKLMKAHRPALEAAGVFSAAQLMDSEYWPPW